MIMDERIEELLKIEMPELKGDAFMTAPMYVTFANVAQPKVNSRGVAKFSVGGLFNPEDERFAENKKALIQLIVEDGKNGDVKEVVRKIKSGAISWPFADGEKKARDANENRDKKLDLKLFTGAQAAAFDTKDKIQIAVIDPATGKLSWAPDNATAGVTYGAIVSCAITPRVYPSIDGGKPSVKPYLSAILLLRKGTGGGKPNGGLIVDEDDTGEVTL